MPGSSTTRVRRVTTGWHAGAMSAPPAVDATRRTRLANERTFLAWWRTALGCEGLAIGIGKVLPEVAEKPEWPYIVLGILFALLGVAMAGAGWWRYATVDGALAGGEEAMAPAWLAASLSVLLCLCGLMVGVLVAVT
jgi:putative membrane protein